MSYEGYIEFICPNGHYHFVDDGYEAEQYKKLIECQICHTRPIFFHQVDVTNGYDESHADTCNAEKEEIGFDDQWHSDHYGNKYATKIFKYKPIGNSWLKNNHFIKDQS